MRPDSANVRAHELIGKAVGYLGDNAGESKPILIVTNVQALAAAVTKQEPEDQEPGRKSPGQGMSYREH